MTDLHTYHLSMVALIGTLFVVSNLWFYVRVLRPIKQLAGQAARLERGDFAALGQGCGGVAEIVQLQRAMHGMATHIQTQLAQSEAYAGQLAAGQEGERKRLAQELHDSTVQTLIAIAQTSELARDPLPPTHPAIPLLTTIRQQAVQAVNDLRDLISDLRPPSLEDLGLPAALGLLAQRAPLSVQLTVHGTPRRLSERAELALFRAAQEALNNAARHGQARHAALRLTYTPQSAALTVQDDGVGFDVPPDLRAYALRGHYGLMGMHERLSALGGSLLVTSRRGHGTVVHAEVHTQAANLTRDPVCGMDIAPEQAYAYVDYGGHTYAFCCPVCKGTFERAPERYVSA